MTATLPTRSPDPAVAALHRRLRPLHAAVFLQGFMLWVSVEKLFMTELGFDAAAVGVIAAAYSALVPLRCPARRPRSARSSRCRRWSERPQLSWEWCQASCAPARRLGRFTTIASWVVRAITTTASSAGSGFSSRCGANGGT